MILVSEAGYQRWNACSWAITRPEPRRLQIFGVANAAGTDATEATEISQIPIRRDL
jgi:hypothetical protein